MDEFNFGTVRDYTKQLRSIRNWALKLRQLRPRIDTTWEEPADWVVKDSNIHGEPARTLTITLMPTGCEWASLGGCTMCGEFEGSTKGDVVSPIFHVAQFASAVSKYVPDYNPSWIRIYQEGNYINQNEIQRSAQLTILSLASLIYGIKRITIESMAKYITPRNVKDLSKSIKRDIELEIGMGFEAENEVIRNVCVNKGESLDDFSRAINLLKEEGIRTVAYVLLKPPFLSEKEAINEAIATIQLANDIGFDAISLEPVSIHAFTLVHALNLLGLYELPWLWSVIKVAQNVQHIRDFRIGGVGFYPRPFNVAHNQHSNSDVGCNKELWDKIKEYGRTRRFEVFNNLECNCKKEWENICKTPTIPLMERIDQQLSLLNLDSYKLATSEMQFQTQSFVNHTTAIAGGTQYKR